MATIFNLPPDVPAPKVDYKNYNHELEKTREADFLVKLRAWLKERFTGDLVGEEVSTPRGDGYARYVIMRHKPFALIHLPLGDAWSADAVWERGIRLKDAREMIERNKAFKEMWNKGRNEQAAP